MNNTFTTTMTLSRAHTSAKAADVAKLLPLNRHRITILPCGLQNMPVAPLNRIALTLT